MKLADVRHPIEDRAALARALAETLGPDRVFTHPADLIAYEYDGSVLTALPDLVVLPRVAVGGSLRGEHGIGIEKNNYMPWIFTEGGLDAQRRLKTTFDPDDLMNPFKVFPTPISCGELMAQRAPRLAASGLWI